MDSIGLLDVLFLAALVFGLLYLLALRIRPTTHLSSFELRRRSKLGDTKAQAVIKSFESAPQLGGLRTLLVILIALLLVSYLIVLFGVQLGVFMSFLTLALAVFIAKKVQSLRYFKGSWRRFNGVRQKIQNLKTLSIFSLTGLPDEHLTFSSREDFMHALHHSKAAIGEGLVEKIEWIQANHSTPVSTIMTAKNKMESVASSELLGPLVLDDLHKTGKRFFPVIEKDDVIGMLDLEEVVHVHHASHAVHEVMRHTVQYIARTDTVKDLLQAFLRTKEHLFIVVNEKKEVVGIADVTDVLKVLVSDSN